MSPLKLDKELEQFRNIMKVPSKFEDGFSWAALCGALFIALVMVPGSIYMGLLIGQGIGGASQWVTTILFLEVARRAHKTLKRPQVFVLFYMAGAAMGQPFQGLLWNQFFVQSQGAIGAGIAEHMEEIWWYAPTDPDVLVQRNFFLPEWWPILGMIVFGQFYGRFSGTVLSYGMFRIASDIEKLPFPMAPVGAAGTVALAEQQSDEEEEGPESVGDTEGKPEKWRWRLFSIGSVLGLVFGTVYAGLPAISSAFLGSPITIFPIPFVDWTTTTSKLLPAFATGFSWDMGNLLAGMVMPFYGVLGGFIGLIITMIANPMLYHFGFLSSWEQGHDTIRTMFDNNIDFYFSFTIGVSIAIAIAGFYQVYLSLRDRARMKKKDEDHLSIEMKDEGLDATRIADRGDIPSPIIIATYFITCFIYIGICGWLIEWHRGVMMCVFFFAFIYTPFISYVTVRLQGMTGMGVSIPFVKEASFLMSGYSGGVKVWFLPIPMSNYGGGASFFRQAELTGTKLWSLWKTDIILTPIILVASILFMQFLWSLGPIPSAAYPYAYKMWELGAANRTIIMTSTLGRFSQFEETFRWQYLVAGAGVGTVLFFVLYSMNLPILLVYGMVGGLNVTMPHGVIPQFIGALIGRYYFQRKLGLTWRQYIPVVTAGFGCGVGLIAVFSVGINFLQKAVISIQF
ncbi:MAG: OPT/YSL family transporter [Phycisphaerae bacterium]|nr:OPT/YSL family transporter [Phycisphaerae bacterium]